MGGSTRLFKLIDDLALQRKPIRWFATDRPWDPNLWLELRAGQYAAASLVHETGPHMIGAITIQTSKGELEDKLTVNMCGSPTYEELPEDQFWIKRVGELIRRTHNDILNLGLFEEVRPGGRPIFMGSGFVDEYAQLWAFSKCDRFDSPTNHGRPYSGGYAIECPECLARIEERWQKKRDELLAQDSIKRLDVKEF